MRRILVAYLVLLTATGPTLCCCSLPRSQGGATAPTATHAPASCSNCCHADSEQRPDEPLDQAIPASEQKGPLPQHRCPCRHHAAQPVAVAQRSLNAEQEPGESATLLPLLPPGSPAILSDNGAEAGPGKRLHPFFWPQELLRAHHRLRC